MMRIDDTVRRLMQEGKGILAADESVATANRRFEEVGVDPTDENRRRWRELLLTTPGIERYVSGVILFDETMRQKTSGDVPFPDLLLDKNIAVGIKVDEGLKPGEGGEVTEGLEGLSARLQEYKNMGASFTKWRAVARVGDGYGDAAMRENGRRIGVYARMVQEFHMVPVVEPEVLMEGVHTAEAAEGALIETMAITLDALRAEHVHLPGIILKTAMAVSGTDAPVRANPVEVAERTVRALSAVVPDDVGGVVFLSGGQAPEEAAANLNAIARLEPLPWPIAFSFSRALQEPVLEEWRGDATLTDEAQAIFLRRLSLAAAADAGGYASGLE